jgi:WD40-like Beta Propeller Repeat
MNVMTNRIQRPGKLAGRQASGPPGRILWPAPLLAFWLARSQFWLLICALVLLAAAPARSAAVSETAFEFLSSGDFNGDGRIDALVLDKATGNARVGYQNADGTLTWAAPVPSGVAQAGSLAVGRFVQTNRDSIAVTSVEFNRIHVVNLSVPGVASAPIVNQPPHPALTMLVALDNPYGTGSVPGQGPDWLAAGAHDPGITLLDLLAYAADGLSFFQDQIVAEDFLVSGSSFRRNVGDVSLLAAIRRGSNDTFLAYTYTNTFGPALSRSNLPPGSEYAFGRFNNETYARLLFYVPGQSNITVQRLVSTAGVIGFGPAAVSTFPKPVDRVFFIDEGSNGVAMVRFGDGVVSGLRPPAGGDGPLQVSYGLGIGPSGNVVPLGAGKFALLTGGSNSVLSVQANVFTKNNIGYVQTSSSALPAATSSGTRANVWLFGAEPFVNAQPGFIASLNGGGWTTALSGLPGTVRVRTETDQGPSSGLGNAATNVLGAPPSGTAFGLANQYHSAISLFSYSAPRAADPSRITISPTPGAYSAAIQVSLNKANPADSAYYRFNGGAWNEYAAPFTVSNDVTIAYYGQTLGGARGTIQQAAYTIADSSLPPLLNTNSASGDTNGPPANTNGSPFQLSTAGTLFYGRQSGSTGSVWAINLDGTGDRFVTTGTRPRVSPDGRWLAFTREGAPFLSQGNLWLRDLTTSEERRLFINPNFVVLYDWLNDSSGLVFDFDCGIYRIGLDGVVTDLPMPNDCYDDAPAVNPFDGSLAFHNLNIAPLRGLYRSDATASTRQRFNISVPGPAWPAWSPNGVMLAFADVRPGTGTGKDLYTMPSDGSAIHQITGFTDATNGFPFGAIWSPNGDALIGAGSIRGVNGLWVLPLDASLTTCVGTPIRLPTTPGDLIDIAGGIRVRIAPPNLFIRHDPGEVVVFWDKDARGFVLESTLELQPGVGWISINGPYTINGGFNEVRIPDANLSETAFFRLIRP